MTEELPPPGEAPPIGSSGGPLPAGAGEQAASAARAREKRVFWAAVTGYLARGVTAAVGLVSVPLTLGYLGPERYGLWVTVSSMALWLSIADLGLGFGLTNEVARRLASEDTAGARRSISSTYAILTVAVGLVGAVGLPALGRIPWQEVFHLSARVDLREVDRVVVAFVACVLLQTLVGLAGKVLAGLQELHLLNALTMAASLLSLAAVVVAIELHASLPLLALSLQGPVVLVLGIGSVVLFGWHRPDLRPSLRGVSARTGIDMLRKGSGFFAIQVAGVVIFQVQAFIISARLSVAEVTPYAVAARLFMTLPPLVAVAFGAIWPAYADAKARGELEWVARVFAGATRRGLLVGGLLIAFLVIWSEPLIRLWAGPAAYRGAALVIAIALLAVLEVWVSSTAVCLNGLGRTRGQVLSAALRAGVGFGLAWYGAPTFGVLGVVVAGLVATVLLAPTILGYDLVTSTGGQVRLRGTVSWITPVTFVVAAVIAWATDFGGPLAAHATTWRALAAGVVAAVVVWGRRDFFARSWGAFQRWRAAGFRL